MSVRKGWEAMLNIRDLVSIDGPVVFRLSLLPLAVEVYKCCPKVNDDGLRYAAQDMRPNMKLNGETTEWLSGPVTAKGSVRNHAAP